MGGKKGEGSNKSARVAQKAEAAAKKAATEDAKKAASEDAEWSKGAKSSAKKEADAAKKAEQARKKAEREAMLADEMKSLPSRAGPKNTKSAVKKTNRGLDDALGQLDLNGNKLPTVEASNVLDAIDALGVDLPPDVKVDRHPERRVGAAFAAFQERRLQEMHDDGSGKGLRLGTKLERIKKEFEKSPENPLSQVRVQHNASKEEIREIKNRLKEDTEARLTSL